MRTARSPLSRAPPTAEARHGVSSCSPEPGDHWPRPRYGIDWRVTSQLPQAFDLPMPCSPSLPKWQIPPRMLLAAELTDGRKAARIWYVMNVPDRRRIQPVNATHSLNFSAGVRKPSVLRGLPSVVTCCGPMALAYERLPEAIKVQIAGLRARHSIEASFGAAMPTEKRLALHAQFPDAEHPVVRTHPETSEKVLFVNAFTTHFTNFHTPDNVRVGQDYAPGASQLLQYLISQASIPEYQVRFRWKPNSVAMWDNRSTQHYAVMDYPPCHRKMERAGIVGDLPY